MNHELGLKSCQNISLACVARSQPYTLEPISPHKLARKRKTISR